MDFINTLNFYGVDSSDKSCLDKTNKQFTTTSGALKMTFSALSSTYQLYKQDTDSVAAWLASTAKSLGFSAAFSSKAPSSKATGSSRLKGKARTQAKMQAATFTTSTKKPEKPAGPKYIINIKDFVPLAEYVAEKATLVPATVGSTIDRVIAARTGFGGQLEKSGKVLSETSNSKHEYFIGGK